MSDNGYFQAVRSRVAEEINKDPNALSLLYLIARRTRWHDGANRHNLKIGEAIVGDYKSCGLTRRKYRDALDRLENVYRQITTVRTRRGTIASLTPEALFRLAPSSPRRHAVQNRPSDLPMKNEETRPTDGQQAANRRPLTNNDIRKERNNDDGSTLRNSIPQAVAKVLAQSVSVFSGSYQNHIKWPEFATWCKSRPNGSPTAKGFDKWLLQQKPQWRNKVKAVSEDEPGYTHNGHFLTDFEADAQAKAHPEIITELKPAVRRPNGTVKTLATRHAPEQ